MWAKLLVLWVRSEPGPADEGKQHGFRERTSRLVSLVKRRVFQLAMQKLQMLPPELTLALFGQSIAANPSLMCKH
jgi:hypothetical protein